MLAQIIDIQTLMTVVTYALEGFAIIIAAMFIFNFITPYNELHEIREGGPYRNGNKAVAWDYGAKIIAISKIVSTSIFAVQGYVAVLIWGVIGIAMLVSAFELFEHFMKDNQHTALQSNNEARGMFCAAISLSIMFIICAVIS